MAALIRQIPAPLHPSDAQIRRQEAEAAEWHFCPLTRDRMVHINQLAADYYQARFPGSWSQRYLTERLRTDLTGHPQIRPGHAPAGWTHLVHHLRRAGVTDDEMLLAGVASQASTGRLIDRFRDRLVLPIVTEGDILGFVARRHPDHDHAGPKYLNTPETPLYKKSNQLYGQMPTGAADHLVPTVVEGPLDALAINIAAGRTHLGLATLGTALTAEHAHHLATFTQAPIIATDADPAGLHAAERAYWHLTPHRLAPRYARWAAGADPAATLHQHGPARVAATLTHAIDLAEHLINQRHDILPAAQADRASLPVLAAADPTWWDRVPAGLLSDFATLVEAWDRDPRAAADHQLANANRIKKQIDNWHQLTPEQRWTPLLTHVDHRVIDTPAWPAIATRLDALHTQGIDVHHAAAAAAAPFNNHSPRAAADGIRAELGQLIESHTEPTPARTRTAHTESSSLAHRPPSPIR